ncbi:menaquinone biosynthesis decarboxylase [Bacteroidia bacterium]|nr:menaquinone biosynthesis decarboxylase [Bacteroidia bacterium]
MRGYLKKNTNPLAHYVAQLEQRGELLRVSAQVSPAFEMAEIVDRCSKDPARNKALLFANNGTQFPVLMNMMGSEARMCAALGVQQLDDVRQRIESFFDQIVSPKITLWDKLKLLPTLQQASQWLPRHSRAAAPCQQVVMPTPNLDLLPITTSWEHDGGRFITLPMVHTQDLQTGIRNVGMYRMQVLDAAATGMHWHKHKTGARHFAQYQAAGQQMPVVVTLGGDPIYTYCATAPLPDGVDEYLLAGFLRSRAVRLVRCITQPIYVAADVDFVIEGYIDPHEDLTLEGPFGDHTGFYSLPDYYPRFHITAITHRRDAIYPATLVGVPPQEDAWMAKASERIFLAPIRKALLPEVLDMNMPPQGVMHNLALVKICKTYEGQALKVANALWGAGQMMLNKILVVTSQNVDIQNFKNFWTIAEQHFDPTKDIYFGKGPLDVLDHAAQQCGYGGKLCIDLTAEHAAPPTPLFALVHKGDPAATARVVVTFDADVNTSNLPRCLWLLGNNIDPERDCKVIDGQLHVDATSKLPSQNPAYTREWPTIAASSQAVQEAVDRIALPIL